MGLHELCFRVTVSRRMSVRTFHPIPLGTLLSRYLQFVVAPFKIFRPRAMRDDRDIVRRRREHEII